MVESHVSGDFVLVEVLHVQAIVNGTAVTAVEVNELKKEHRRHKRDIDTERVSFSESYPMEKKLFVSVTNKRFKSYWLSHYRCNLVTPLNHEYLAPLKN